ncbi:MAG: methanogenesis marker 5 protein [Candidatus Methanoliparum thermophilum]|uniref:Methanogenesis marker 5 protein n=1 Tax=Methanoliparum thermophilum TaxID=2491083 RepID=A0A520KSY5_METT2|nr:methanogenesis marker 5 protein [Candidatus Methanoliparum sp. LAM-1]RZN65021.1 MAG: methanogenesis marker 5 protein [Candidatus Methanoliparum thermophilum]BDC36092.1 methanogenesis marker 5 protein [Candidatus Methanoliparum sp. LAM-1]
MKIFIFPPTSLILSDLVERFGHDPLAMMKVVRERVTGPSLDSPPINVTPNDVKDGLKYVAVEVPSGVRGRLALMAPLVEKADAAIMVKNADYTFGCVGCARTNEYLRYFVKRRRIPYIELEYPYTEEEAKEFVISIKNFLSNLENKNG